MPEAQSVGQRAEDGKRAHAEDQRGGHEALDEGARRARRQPGRLPAGPGRPGRPRSRRRSGPRPGHRTGTPVGLPRAVGPCELVEPRPVATVGRRILSPSPSRRASMLSSEPMMPPMSSEPEHDQDPCCADGLRHGWVQDGGGRQRSHEEREQSEPVGDDVTGPLGQPVAEGDSDGGPDQDRDDVDDRAQADHRWRPGARVGRAGRRSPVAQQAGQPGGADRGAVLVGDADGVRGDACDRAPVGWRCRSRSHSRMALWWVQFSSRPRAIRSGAGVQG